LRTILHLKFISLLLYLYKRLSIADPQGMRYCYDKMIRDSGEEIILSDNTKSTILFWTMENCSVKCGDHDRRDQQNSCRVVA